MPPLRLIFMGTADLAATSLRALLQAPDLQVVAVVTQPDRPRGRSLKLIPSAVKVIALEHQLPLLQPERARQPEFISELARFQPDLIVVAAYGQILPLSILGLPPFGCLNVHTSLLPLYRGAAPIQFALLNGDRETGVTIMQMDEGMDTGDILTQATTAITPDDNAQILHDRLALLGAELLVTTIPDLVAGRITPRKQDPARATYTRKITKQDGRIDWHQPACRIWNQIRALTPWPGAFTHRQTDAGPSLLKVWDASVVEDRLGNPGTLLQTDRPALIVACGEQALELKSVQLEGRNRLDAAQFLAGTPIKPGEALG